MWSYNHSPPPSEFYHHGVKGMKWGVRKEYTPTPRKSGSSEEVTYGSFKSKAARGAVIALSILSSLSPIPIASLTQLGMEIHNANKIKQERGQELVEQDFEMAKKDKEYTSEQDQRKVNPGFTGLGGGNSNNCSNCTLAYELRRRGFDISAKPLYGGRKIDDISSLFGNPKKQKLVLKDRKDDDVANILGLRGGETKNTLTSKLAKYPDGSRGAVTLRFNTGMGHIFNWEVSNGTPRFVDSQNYGSKPDRYFEQADSNSIEYFRTDNAEINMKLVHESVKNRR